MARDDESRIYNLAGKTLGHYLILRFIGKGGMGIVYETFDPTLQRKLAIKILLPELLHNPGFVQRFKREAVTAASLKHCNIVTIHEVGEQDGLHYIAMECIEGLTLKEIIKTKGRLPLDVATSIVSQIADALTYAYEQGKVIHRDVKPDNVIVDQRGKVTLTDFGLAKALESETDVTSIHGGHVGTPRYMSPEHVKGEDLDQRSDIYSLGVVFYEMVTGRTPFQGKTTTSLLHAHVYEPPPPPRQFAPDLPKSVESVLLRALAKDPDSRFSTARDMAEALGGGKVTESLPARGRVPVVWIAGALIVLGLIGLAGLMLLRPGEEGGSKVAVLTAETVQGTLAGKVELTVVRPEATSTKKPTSTPNPTLTTTNTPVATSTPRPTDTPTATASCTSTATHAPTATRTPTHTLTATDTPTHTPTATNTPSHTPTATDTPTYTPTATATPTADLTATEEGINRIIATRLGATRSAEQTAAAVAVETKNRAETRAAEALATTAAARPTSTDTPPSTPTWTRTPSATPSPVPTDETLYDDFNDPQYDGGFDSQRWRVGSGSFMQQGGMLVVSNEVPSWQQPATLDAVKYQSFRIEQPMSFEAELMSFNNPKSHVALMVGTELASVGNWWTACTLGDGVEERPQPVCYLSSGRVHDIYMAEGVSVDRGTLHPFRIEVDSDDMRFTYFVDGRQIGSCAPDNSEELREASFWFSVGLSGEELASGYIDDVRIGPIKGREAALPYTAKLGDIWIRPKDGVEMVYVPAGEFPMGSNDGEDDEQPVHEVTLDGFWIDRTEVTNVRFSQFVEATGHQTNAEKEGKSWIWNGTKWELVNGADWRYPGGPGTSIIGLDEHPVVQVSWDDAQAYCEWAEARLPTEAEWEKAARGADGRRYPWGSEAPTSDLCNFEFYIGMPNKVGSYPAGASPYGVLDIAGNVWEWVADRYDESFYSRSPERDPTGPSSGGRRVLRGGSWVDSSGSVRSARRDSSSQSGGGGVDVGFRCAKNMDAPVLPTMTLTHTPVPAPLPDAEVREYLVTLRESPEMTAPVLGSYSRGTPLRALATSGDWLQVETPNGKVGWMIRKYLKLSVDLAGLPRATAAPTLTSEFEAVVNVYAISLRESPNITAPIKATATKGLSLKVVGRDASGEWLQAETPGGQVGWLLLTYVSLDVSPVLLPVIEPPPAPTVTPSLTLTLEVKEGTGTPLLVDDFDDPANDGRWNEQIWQPSDRTDQCEVGQQNGYLRMSCTQPTGTILHGFRKNGLKLKDIEFVQAQLMLSREIVSTGGNIALNINLPGEGWWAECGIRGATGEDMAHSQCQLGNHLYAAKEISLPFDQWHDLRVEVHHDTGRLAFYVNGQEIGAYRPADIERLWNAEASVDLQVSFGNGSLVTGYADDVQVGLVDQPAEQASAQDAGVDPTLYDDFNNRIYDSGFDPTRWRIESWSDRGGGGDHEAVQQDGVMTLKSAGMPTGVSALRSLLPTEEFVLTEPTFFEAKLMSKDNPDSHVFMVVHPALPSHDQWTDCALGYTSGNEAWSGCSYNYATRPSQRYEARSESVSMGTWHTFRVEVEPDTMLFRYYVDGKWLGSYTPDNPEDLSKSRFYFQIGIYGSSARESTGYIDDVRIGPLHAFTSSTPTPTRTSVPTSTRTPRPTPTATATIDADPAVYDNFNNPAYDGSFNPDQWVYWTELPNDIAQEEGILRIRKERPKESGETGTGLLASKYAHFKLREPMFFEAKLLFDTDNHLGDIQFGIFTDISEHRYWWSRCAIDHAGNPYCQDRTWPGPDDFSETIESSGYGAWHSFRIEIEPDPMMFTYYIDGQKIARHRPAAADTIVNADFRFNVAVFGNGAVAGSVDDVRIGPLPCTNDLAFATDVTAPDGTVFEPGEKFDKTWRVRNTGNCVWGENYRLTFVSGQQMGAPDKVAVPAAQAGETIDISVPMVAPDAPGKYSGVWQLADGEGRFGHQLIVVIEGKPVKTGQFTYKVPAYQRWVDTGLVIDSDSTVTISATGIVDTDGLHDWGNSDPDGQEGNGKPDCVMPQAPFGRLLGKIGRSGRPFDIGKSLEFVASESGKLYLTVNDNGYLDNSGLFEVDVTVGR